MGFCDCVDEERRGQGRYAGDEKAIGNTAVVEEHRCLSERVRDGSHSMTETPRNPGVRSLKHDDLSLPEPGRSNPSPEINGRQHKVCLTYIVKL